MVKFQRVDFRMPEAGKQMVIDHVGDLHMGAQRRRPQEAESRFLHFLYRFFRHRGDGRHVFCFSRVFLVALSIFFRNQRRQRAAVFPPPVYKAEPYSWAFFNNAGFSAASPSSLAQP